MRKIALFGGSFDPIHKGHIEIAKIAMEKEELDEVIFIPSGKSPHKEELESSPEERFLMTCLATEGIEGFSVSDFEIKKETKCYTFETVTAFKEFYPGDELYFIMGDDQYKVFSSWYKSKELLELCKFIVFTREGENILPPFLGINIEPILISSSEIREKIKKGESVKDFLCEKTEKYIRDKKLYR